MIRSGLTNIQKAGYLGYPHERDPNPRNQMERPFVSLGDATILYKSDFSDPQANSTVTPSPVLYDDIFAKRTTPDERLYVLKQIQQGLSKIQKGLLGKDAKQVPGVPLPNQPGQIIPTPPFGQTGNTIGRPPGGQPPGSGPGGDAPGGDGPAGDGPAGDGSGGPGSGGFPGGFPGGMPDLISPSTSASSGNEYFEPNEGLDLAEEELAQEVVANPPVQTSANEEERATNEWLHMQHDPQWAQIEGRTFNTSVTAPYSPIYPTVPSPLTESLGAYGPNSTGIYPSLSPSTASPVAPSPEIVFNPNVSPGVRSPRIALYPTGSPRPDLSTPISSGSNVSATQRTASTVSDGHAFSGRTDRTGTPIEQTQLQFLNFLATELLGKTYEEQVAYMMEMPLEQREAIGYAALAHPTHSIVREPIFIANFPLFSPGTRSATTPNNCEGILSAGARRTASPVTPSPTSIATTVSSNGVGPRSRQSIRSSGSAMQVDTPPIRSGSAMLVDTPPIPEPRRRRALPPPPIQTNLQRTRPSVGTPGIADAHLNPGRRYRGVTRAARTQILGDAIRQRGLDTTRRPRQPR